MPTGRTQFPQIKHRDTSEKEKGRRKKGESLPLKSVKNRPRFGCYSQLPTEAYWPTVISVSTWLPVSSVLSARYCLSRHCVFKSLATLGHDRIISSASTTKYMCGVAQKLAIRVNNRLALIGAC